MSISEYIDKLDLKRYCVRISAGPKAGGTPCIYLKKGFSFNQFMKWKWYFEYRAALYKVQNPRHYVEYQWSSYNYVPEREELIKRCKNKIIHAKGKITQCENSLRLAKQHWNELFPIEDEDEKDWKRVVKKLEEYNCKLKNLESELIKLKEE